MKRSNIFGILKRVTLGEMLHIRIYEDTLVEFKTHICDKGKKCRRLF